MFHERVSRIVESSREHWLFIPLFSLLLFTFFYVFFIGDKGWLAYRSKLAEVEDLKLQIESLKDQKKEMRQKLILLKNKDAAVNKFSRESFLFQEKVRILKFTETAETATQDTVVQPDLRNIQKIFVATFFIAMTLITLFYYRRQKKTGQLANTKPFEIP